MFMTDASPTLDDAQTQGPRTDQRATRSAWLLGFLSQVLEYGRTLLADLQQRNTTDAPPAIAYQFGSVSLALIIARITRGIMLATALHDRVTRGARRLDAPPNKDAPTRAARPDESGRPVRPERKPVDEAAELHNLPSAREIAERIRRQPIGVVLEEICRDLGIDGHHPLWRDVFKLITFNGGSYCRLFRIVTSRGSMAHALGVSLPPLPLGAQRVVAIQNGFDPTRDDPPLMATPPP